MILGFLEFLRAKIAFSSLGLSLVFIILLVAWAIYSLILRYHWQKYSSTPLDALRMNMIYFGGSALLFGLMAVFLLLFSLSSNAIL
jgi:hypothetical protein